MKVEREFKFLRSAFKYQRARFSRWKKAAVWGQGWRLFFLIIRRS